MFVYIFSRYLFFRRYNLGTFFQTASLYFALYFPGRRKGVPYLLENCRITIIQTFSMQSRSSIIAFKSTVSYHYTNKIYASLSHSIVFPQKVPVILYRLEFHPHPNKQRTLHKGYILVKGVGFSKLHNWSRSHLRFVRNGGTPVVPCEVRIINFKSALEFLAWAQECGPLCKWIDYSNCNWTVISINGNYPSILFTAVLQVSHRLTTRGCHYTSSPFLVLWIITANTRKPVGEESSVIIKVPKGD